jgi:two-component system chemotaxis response regulator CheB
LAISQGIDQATADVDDVVSDVMRTGLFEASSADRLLLVALVCSAGGLPALKIVLGGLPAAFPAALIVLQHHSPHHVSLLAKILDRSCELSVSEAVPNVQLRPGTVVVVPAGKHALVTRDDCLALIASDGPPPARPSADLLLTSLAVVAGDRAIAVILSGSGRDGATGATAVHDLGGTVLASDKESSDHFGMPAAAIGRDHCVDFVLPLDQISQKLVDLVANDDVPESQPTR